MILKLFWNEIKRNKVINGTLFFFMMLSAVLVSSAIFVSLYLVEGIDQLSEKARTPHFVQMHAGTLDEAKVYNYKDEDVDDFQLVKMLNVQGRTLYISDTSEARSVMDISFVKQNQSFDFLLDMNNEVAVVEQGGIGIPIYYRNNYNLAIGDEIKLKTDESEYVFKITSFIRDSQMNAALASSKRFLISDEDYDMLSSTISEAEYLLEYRLTDASYINEFSNRYSLSDMPKTGPAVTLPLFKMMNGLTDGMVIIVLLLVSMILTGLGILCLRYTLINTLDEDYREIGVMKAIGLPYKNIRKLYLSKNMLLAVIASITGYVLSIFLNNMMTKNITEFMGNVEISIVSYILPILGVCLVFLMIALSTIVILRRIKKISVIAAITNRVNKRKSLFQLKLSKIPTEIFLGLNAIVSNMKSYVLLLLIFVSGVMIILVPMNVFMTLSSPTFIDYMGVGKSDIRMDLRETSKSKELISDLSNDDRIDEFAVFKTYQMKAINDQGEVENLPIEIGQLDAFPIQYKEGEIPKEGEIALSVLAANNLDKKIGDDINASVKGEIKQLKVSGIYQDITNGGKTSKATGNIGFEDSLWFVISINLNDQSEIDHVIKDYRMVSGLKITDTADYLSQTLGGTIKQMKFVSVISTIIALGISGLITALFMKMMLTKERREIAVLRSIGFNKKHIEKQFNVRVMIILLVSILLGILLSSTLGESLVSGIAGIFGASEMNFVINPWMVFILTPIVMIVTVLFVNTFSIRIHKTPSIRQMIVE